MTIKAIALMSALAVFASTGARASTTLYSDFGSYSSAVTGISTANVATISQADTFLGNGDATVTYDNVTFSTSAAIGQGDFFNVSPGFSGLSYPVLSSQHQTSGVPNILISLPSAATGFSVNFGTFEGGAVTFTLSNGDKFTLDTVGHGYSLDQFFGITDTTSFTSVLLTIDGALLPPFDDVLSLNNVTFGSISAVPEPSTWAMLLLGFAGIAAMTYRRRQATVVI